MSFFKVLRGNMGSNDGLRHKIKIQLPAVLLYLLWVPVPRHPMGLHFALMVPVTFFSDTMIFPRCSLHRLQMAGLKKKKKRLKHWEH